MGRQTKRREGGGWEYPPLAAAMEEVGFEERGAYVLNSQNMVVQYIVTQTILEL